jgi:transposase-like protein
MDPPVEATQPPDQSEDKHDDSYDVVQRSFEELGMDGPFLPQVNKKRRRFTALQKVSLVRKVDCLCAEGKSNSAACDEVNVDRTQLARWRKQMPQFKAQFNKKAKSLCRGGKSSLQHVEADLLRFIVEYRAQAKAVTTTMVLCQACRLDRDFKNKTFKAQKSAIRRLIERNGMVVYNIAPRNFRDRASRHRDVIINNESDDDETGDDASMDTYVTV